MSKISIIDYIRTDVESKKHLEDVRKGAEKHTKGHLDIPFIEHSVDSILIYNHMLAGQISPKYIRKLSTDDLIYIAGHIEPDASLSHDTMARVKANAIRAQHEIDRRSNIRTLIITSIVTSLAAFVGAVIGGD